MCTIGKTFFDKDKFERIAELYQEKITTGRPRNPGRRSNAEQAERTINSHFWNVLAVNVNGFSEAALDYVERNRPGYFIISLVEELYKDNGEDFNETIRNRFDQYLRNLINDDGVVNDRSHHWVDLFSALNKRFNIFSDDLRNMNETRTAFYNTKMSELAFELGWQDDLYLYVRNPRDLSCLCAVLKCKTENFARGFYSELEEARGSTDSADDWHGTYTITNDIRSILAGDEWEEKIIEYVRSHSMLFDGKNDDSNTISNNLVAKLYSRSRVQIYHRSTENVGQMPLTIEIDDGINKESSLFRKLFYVRGNNIRENENRNIHNLLVYGGENEYTETVSYMRKLLIIRMAEEFMEWGLPDGANFSSEMNNILFKVGVRPINATDYAYRNDVFDWYVLQRFELERNS